MSAIDKNTPVTYDMLFSRAKSWPYTLLLIVLFFSAFRPDRLLPGGSVLTYIPTLIILLLLLKWLPLQGKVLKNTQTRFYFLFILLMVAQLPFVRNYGFAKNTVQSTLIYGIPLYLFSIQFIDTFPRIIKYIRLFTILGAFLALFGLSGGKVANIPMLADENDFCLYVNYMIPFAFFLSQEAETLKKKIFYYCLLAIYLGANVATFSRGGFVGLVLLGAYLFFQTKKRFMYLVIISVTAIVLISFAPSEYLTEIGNIDIQSGERDTGSERMLSWSAGWRMFLDNPIFGVGVQNFGAWFPDYWLGEKGSTMWGRVAHSLYFTLLPEMGVVGFFLVAGMLWGNVRDHRFICRLEKNKEILLADSTFTLEEKDKISTKIRTLYFFSHAYGGALVAYLGTGIFISVLWYSYFWQLTTFYVLTGNLARKTKKMLLSSQSDKIQQLPYSSEMQ